MASNKTLVFSIAFISCVFIVQPEAEAGCDTSKARAYSINLSTQAKSPIDQGLVTECGNMSGAFISFKGRKLDFGWDQCLNYCNEGFIPGKLYVRVGKTFKQGSGERDGREKACMQQFGSATMYCHEVLRDN